MDADVYVDAAARLVDLYQRRLRGAQDNPAATQVRRADEAERMLRKAALHAERDTIFRLAREAQISDAVSRRLVRDIDLAESRYR